MCDLTVPGRDPEFACDVIDLQVGVEAQHQHLSFSLGQVTQHVADSDRVGIERRNRTSLFHVDPLSGPSPAPRVCAIDHCRPGVRPRVIDVLPTSEHLLTRVLGDLVGDRRCTGQ